MIRQWLRCWLEELLGIAELRKQVADAENALKVLLNGNPSTKVSPLKLDPKKQRRDFESAFAAWPRSVLEQVDWDRMGLEPPQEEK